MTDDRTPFREPIDRSEFEANRDAGLAKRHEQRLARQDLAIVKAAIEHLPAECRYHGENLDRPIRWGGGACCDTGKPALARREAEAALERLTP